MKCHLVSVWIFGKFVASKLKETSSFEGLYAYDWKELLCSLALEICEIDFVVIVVPCLYLSGCLLGALISSF